MATLRDLLVSVGFSLDKSSLRKTESSIDVFKNNLLSSFKQLAIAFSAIAAPTAIITMTKEISNQAIELQKLAKYTNTSTQALQEFLFIGEKSRITQQEAAGALKSLTSNMRNTAYGTGEAIRAFAELGVRVTDNNGKMRNVLDVVEDLSTAFQRTPDGVKKTANAMLVFGSNGAELVETLGKGPQALEQIRKEFRAGGFGFSDQELKTAADFQDSIVRFNKDLQRLKIVVGTAVIPVLTMMVDWLVEFGKQSRKYFSKGIDFVKKFSTELKVTAASIGLIAAGALGISVLTTAIKGASLATLGLQLAMAPLLLVVGAVIAAIALLAEDFYVFKTGGDSVIGDLMKLADPIKGISDIVRSVFKDKLGIDIESDSLLVLETTLKVIKSLIDDIILGFKYMAEVVANAFTQEGRASIVEDAIDVAKGAALTIREDPNFIDNLLGFIGSRFDPAAGGSLLFGEQATSPANTSNKTTNVTNNNNFTINSNNPEAVADKISEMLSSSLPLVSNPIED